MNKEKLTEFSIEELKQKEKTTKHLTGALVGILTVLVVVCIFLTIKNGFSVFSVLPIPFFSILLVNFRGIKKIKAELESRK